MRRSHIFAAMVAVLCYPISAFIAWDWAWVMKETAFERFIFLMFSIYAVGAVFFFPRD